jgi:hypothetical protein
MEHTILEKLKCLKASCLNFTGYMSVEHEQWFQSFNLALLNSLFSTNPVYVLHFFLTFLINSEVVLEVLMLAATLRGPLPRATPGTLPRCA